MATPSVEVRRAGIPDLLLGPCVHGGALTLLPRVSEAPPRDLLVEGRRDLRLLQAGSDPLSDQREDLLRLGDCRADAFHLERGLTAA